MFRLLLDVFELFAFVGLVRSIVLLHNFCVKHAWTKHSDPQGAWKFSLTYGVFAIAIFGLAVWYSQSFVLTLGMLTFGTVAGVITTLLVGYILVHTIVGGLYLLSSGFKIYNKIKGNRPAQTSTTQTPSTTQPPSNQAKK